MRPGSKELAAAGAASVLMAIAVGGMYAAQRRRQGRYYQSFLCAINEAIGHYRGTMHAVIECEDSIADHTVAALLGDQPPVALDDEAELHCDVAAFVTRDAGLQRLNFTISGPTEVVRYLYRRLRSEPTLSVECTHEPHIDGQRASVAVAINVFEHDDVRIASVAERLPWHMMGPTTRSFRAGGPGWSTAGPSGGIVGSC